MENCRLHYVHIMMQHAVQECTLDVYVFGFKIPHYTDAKPGTQCRISLNGSPSLKEINSVDLFKSLSNISGLKTFDLALGATLNLKNPFSR